MYDMMSDAFHSWCLFESFLTYQHLLIIPVWLIFPLNMAAFPVQILKENKQDLLYKFLGTCFWHFWICLQVIGHHSVHTGCNIGLDIWIQGLPRHFWHVCSRHPWCYSLSGYCKIPSFLVMKFCLVCPKHQCANFLFFFY